MKKNRPSAAVCIQRWWRKTSMQRASKRIQQVRSQLRARKELLLELERETSILASPTRTRSPVMSISPTSSLRSSRAAGLLSFLEESQEPSKPALSSEHLEVQSLRLELDNAHKTLSSLKDVIFKQKEKLSHLAEQHKKELEESLAKQKTEYEEKALSNVNFIEQLLAEKEKRMKQMADLSAKLKDNEKKHAAALNSMREKFQIELKKSKDAWYTAENLRKEQWVKEKSKEIKEITAKGLEPEIMRLIADHKRNVENLQSEHAAEIRELKLQYDTDYEFKLSEARQELKDKYESTLEEERSNYQQKVSEIRIQQENEFATLRQKWSSDVQNEREKHLETRRLDEERYHSKLKQIEEDWEDRIKALQKKHSEELYEQQLRLDSRASSLKEEIKIEKEEWIQSQINRMNREYQDKIEQTKETLNSQRDTKLKQIVEKLGEETATMKKDYERQAESKVKTMTQKYKVQINELQNLNEQLRNQLDTQNDQKRNYDKDFSEMTIRITEKERIITTLKDKNAKLQETVRDMNDKVDELQDNYADSRKLYDVVQKQKHKIEMLERKVDTQREKHEEEIAEMTRQEAEEFSAIEQRVKMTIQKKDNKINELNDQLSLAQLKNRKLEELLEDQRRDLMNFR